MEDYPMTEEQRQYLGQDLAAMMENLVNIANLLRACHGDRDMTVVRAEEARGAVQRIVWAVERRHANRHGAGG